MRPLGESSAISATENVNSISGSGAGEVMIERCIECRTASALEIW